MKKGVVLFIILCLYGACTPYDGNKVNNDLLQGEWMMVDMYYILSDSTIVSEYKPNDSILLQFDGNEYLEYIRSENKRINLKYNVLDYRILLYKDSSIYDWTNIDILTPDSLVLSKANKIWQYKKVK